MAVGPVRQGVVAVAEELESATVADASAMVEAPERLKAEAMEEVVEEVTMVTVVAAMVVARM